MKILLFDDSPLVRDALKALLRRTFDAVEIQDEDSIVDVDQALANARPDMVIVNISALAADIPSSVRGLVAAAAPAPVVALDSRTQTARIQDVKDCGCRGYIPLTVAGNLIAAALGVVAAGGQFYPAPAAADPAAPPDMNRLSARQREVARQLAEGKTNQEIARDLGIAVSTVKLHVHAILAAIGVRNRTEAALWARAALEA